MESEDNIFQPFRKIAQLLTLESTPRSQGFGSTQAFLISSLFMPEPFLDQLMHD